MSMSSGHLVEAKLALELAATALLAELPEEIKTEHRKVHGLQAGNIWPAIASRHDTPEVQLMADINAIIGDLQGALIRYAGAVRVPNLSLTKTRSGTFGGHQGKKEAWYNR